jgi:hypothetical protein
LERRDNKTLGLRAKDFETSRLRGVFNELKATEPWSVRDKKTLGLRAKDLKTLRLRGVFNELKATEP